MTGNAEFKTLEHTGIEQIYEAFNEAFSDYAVRADMPPGKFKIFLKSNGFEPSMSAGAYMDGVLCAFVLNGVRDVNGVKTAYDSGTGVVPGLRRQGLTKGMFAFLMPLLKKRGVKRYVLEVIRTNEPAFKLYLEMGFEVKRELKCFEAQRDNIKPADDEAVRLADVSQLDAKELSAFWDYIPTWQNSFDSVMAEPGRYAAAMADANGEAAGYGIINIASGRVYQLAVKGEYRGRGMGTALLGKLKEQTAAERITFLNVDAGCGSMAGFLQSFGFEEYVGQYEMELDIKD